MKHQTSRRRTAILGTSIAALLTLSLGVSRTQAAPNNWTGTTNASWDTTTNWSTAAKPIATDDVTFPAAIPATGATITLTAGEVANSLTFNNSYTLTGGNLTLTATGGTVTVAPTFTATVNSVLAGTGSPLTKVGTGTLTLGGVNTYTGATNVVAGTLSVAAGGSTAAGSAVTVGAVGTLAGAGTVNGATTLNGGIVNLTGGTIANTLTVNGGNWNGTGTVTGVVTSQSGTFTIGAGANLTATAGLNVTGGSIAAGSATSTITGSVNYTSGTSSAYTGVIAGAASTVTMNNAASTLTLSGANTYGGGTTLIAGTLNADNNTALGTGPLNIQGGTLGNTVDGITLANSVVAQGNFSVAPTATNGLTVTGPFDLKTAGSARVITGTTAGGKFHIGGVISDSGTNSGVTFAGAAAGTNANFYYDGTAANTYTGLTTVQDGAVLNLNSTAASGAIVGAAMVTGTGVLKLQKADQIADTSTVTVNGGGNGTDQGFELNNFNETIGALNGSAAGTVGLGSGTLTVGAGNFAGVITDGANGAGGQLVKTGPGTLTLSGANTYTGGTTLSGGTTQISNDNNLGAATGPVTFNNNAILQTLASVTFSSTRTFTINATQGTLDLNGFDSALNSTVTGAGVFNIINSTGSAAAYNVLDLTGNASGNGAFTGGFAAGNFVTLKVSQDNQLGAPAAPLSLDQAQLHTTATFTSTRTITLAGAVPSTINVDPGVVTTLNGQITGTTGFTKIGTGTLALGNATSNYTGATALAEGTLLLNASSTPAASGPVTQGPIGTGALLISGGTTIGSQVDGTSVANDVQVFGDFSTQAPGANQSYTLAGSVNMVGDVVITSTVASGTTNFGGGISSDGTITINSTAPSGIVEYSGANRNTYTGLTTVNDNAVLLLNKTATDGAIQGDVIVNQGGVVALGQNDQIANSSTVTVNSTGNTLGTVGQVGGLDLAGNNETIGTLLGSGNVQLNDGALDGTGATKAGTFTVGAGTFSGVISDAGLGGQLVKVGPGALVLTGANTYVGNTAINGGLLQVDGSITSRNTLVSPGGTLSGIGRIGGNVINSGVVTPGHSGSIGALTVGGGYTQTSAGTLVIRIADKNPGQYDQLAVNGPANLNGALRLVKVGGGPRLKVGEKIPFLTAAGGVTGQFSSVTNPFTGTELLKPEVVYGNTDVSLELVQSQFLDVLKGLTPNQKAVAKTLDGALNDRRLGKVVQYLDQRPLSEIPADLDRIAPEELTAIYTLGVSLAKVQTSNIERRTDDLRAGSNGFSAAGYAANGSAPSYSGPLSFRTGAAGPTGDGKTSKSVMTPADDNRWGVFLTGVGEWTNVSGDYNARGYDMTTGGFTFGADYKVTPNFAIGLSAGYAGTGVDLNNGGRILVNGGKLGLYATYFTGGFYTDTAVNGGYNSYDTRRSALQGQARGDTDGGELNVLFGTGYDFKAGALTFGPTATFNYTYVGVGDFTERGSLAPLHYGNQNADSIRTAIGMKASYDWKLGGVVIRPEVRAAWQHEFGDNTYAWDSSLASGAGNLFTVSGPEIGRDSLLLSGGFAILWNERTSTYVYYDGELGRSGYDSNNISGGLRVSF